MFFPNHLMRVLRRVMSGAVEMRWSVALGVTVAHALSCFIGLKLLGETELVSGASRFVYFYVVTGSTVGYGDYSPASEIGGLFTALWVIPGSISLFALMIGKIIGAITITMRNIMNGFGDFSEKRGHIVVIGHVPGQTERLLDETERLHGSREVVVVATEDLAGPPKDWAWVRTSSLSRRDDLARAGIAGADFVVILGKSDDEGLAACLAVSALQPAGHVVAYFRQESSAELIRSHHPTIEIVTSSSTEQVARAISDPGSGEVLRRLVSTRVGGTLNSMIFRGSPKIAAETLSSWMRKHHKATLIGYRPAPGEPPVISIDEDTVILEGQPVYYIADQRLADGIIYNGPGSC